MIRMKKKRNELSFYEKFLFLLQDDGIERSTRDI